MSKYEEVKKVLEETCGNGKDNVIALSTIARDVMPDGSPYPCVREVDAYYEEGTFYVTTWAKSNKMQEIAKNNAVAFAVNFEGISGNGIGENIGWILDPKNAAIRAKLRKAFSDWYDQANNEQDENCVILAVHIRRCKVFRDHGAVSYSADFADKAGVQ